MGKGDPLYRATHLGLDQWNNIPEESDLQCSYNHDASRRERQILYRKVVSFLLDLMSNTLTTRQFDVMKLYHLEYNMTQAGTAKLLHITQPTVNQHLKGKKRGGKSVGGAYRRIRKQVKKRATLMDLSSDECRILHFLSSLAESNITPRKRHRLLLSLK